MHSITLFHGETSGKDVFKTLKDREKFLEYLGSATERYGAVVHTWCQVSNHYHLLLETPRGNLSEIMHHVNGAYTTYFNVKRKRSGHLFQGRYKAILVESSQYATELSRYIHLNPVRARVVERPEEYQWSSCRGYIGEDEAPRWLRRDFIHGHFGKTTKEAQMKYRCFVEDALNGDYVNPLARAVAGSILGSEDFAETIIAAYLEKEERDCNVAALWQMSVQAGPALEKIVNAVESVFIASKKEARQAAMYFCHRYSGTKLREVAEQFVVKDAAITAASRRFELLLENDVELRERVKKVTELLEFKMYRRDPVLSSTPCFRPKPAAAFPGKGHTSESDAETIRQLKRENERLKMKREILKKQWPSFRKAKTDLRVHLSPAGGDGLPRLRQVRDPLRLKDRLLRLALQARKPEEERGRRAFQFDQGDPRGKATANTAVPRSIRNCVAVVLGAGANGSPVL